MISAPPSLTEPSPEMLAALEAARRERNKPIESVRELSDEILKVLIFTLAYQSKSFKGGTAEELESIQRRAIQKFQTDPLFRAFIANQRAAIMQLVDRYRPR